MVRPFLSFILLTLVVSVLSVSGLCRDAAAESTITCHCFQDRQFTPDHPQAFDPYLLATVQNRLMSHVFQVPRADIVKAKMGGLGNSRLWVAYYVAARSGRSLDEILEAHGRSTAWFDVVQQRTIDPEQFNSRFLADLVQKASEERLAWDIVSALLVDHFAYPTERLATLPVSDMAVQENILAATLGSISGQPLDAILARRDQYPSWGALLAAARLTIADLEAEMQRRLRPPAAGLPGHG